MPGWLRPDWRGSMEVNLVKFITKMTASMEQNKYKNNAFYAILGISFTSPILEKAYRERIRPREREGRSYIAVLADSRMGVDPILSNNKKARPSFLFFYDI